MKAASILLALAIASGTVLSSQTPSTPEPTATPVTGRVTDETGAPLADVAVLVGVAEHLLPAVALAQPTTKTDADGRYTVTVAGQWSDQILLVAKGRATAFVVPHNGVARFLRALGGGLQHSECVVLPPGTEFRGRVLGAGGKPLAGAEIEAWDTLANRMGAAAWESTVVCYGSRARTGPDGRFVLPGVFAEAMAVKVRAPGHLTQTLRPVDRSSPLTIELQPIGVCRGRVVDGEGRPVVADVSAGFEGGTVGDSVTIATGSDGRFELQLPFAGRYQLSARAAQPDRSSEPRLLSGPTDDVTLTLQPAPAGPLAVRAVAAADGAPIPQFRAGVQWMDEPDEAFAQVLSSSMRPSTDSVDGVARLREPLGNEPPTGRVVVEAAGFARTTMRGVKWDAAKPEVLVKLEREASVAGRVLGPDGQPVAGALVKVAKESKPPAGIFVLGSLNLTNDDQVTTAADGTFFMGELAAGTYQVSATALDLPATSTREIKVGAGEAKAGLELVFKRGATLTGKLKGLATDRPVELTYTLEPQIPRGMEGAFLSTVFSRQSDQKRSSIGPDGTYKLAGLAPGTYQLQLLSWAHPRAGMPVPIALGSVKVGTEDCTKEFDVTGKLQTTLRGKVTLKGAAVPTTRLAAIAEVAPEGGFVGFNMSWTSGSRAPVSATGEFALRVAPGTYRVQIVDLLSGLDLATDQEPVIVPVEGAALDVPLELGRLRVTLRPQDGPPVVVTRLELRHISSLDPQLAAMVGGMDYDHFTGMLWPVGQSTLELAVPLGDLAITARNNAAALRGDGESVALGRAEVTVGKDAVAEVELKVTAPAIAPPR